MKISAAFFKAVMAMVLGLSALSSCDKDDEIAIVPPLDDNSRPSAAIVNIIVTEKKDNTLRLKMDVAVFKDSRNMETQLKPDQFIIDTLRYGGIHAFKRGRFTLSGAQRLTNYSALMLMDQSGSISGTDPRDYRLDAAKTFCSNLGSGNQVVLWSFKSSIYTAYGNGFTNDTASVIAQIEALRNKEGGSTPLYKSQVAATDYCSANGTAAGKAVLAFTDGGDTEGGYTPEQVAANAVAKKVRLFNIGLGNAETVKLCRQAVATGGAFMFAKDARQLISMFGNLGKLLDGSARFYQTEWQITRQNNFTSGNLSHELRILLPYGEEELRVPFSVDY
ncbi:MAG: VWA domain-containing protein [Niabella sp.]